MTRRIMQWAHSWPVFLVMCAWLAVFAWQHVMPGKWRQAVQGIDLPDARAGAAAPDVAPARMVHRED